MQFISQFAFALVCAAIAALPALAQTSIATTINHDTLLDNASASLSSTACSANAGDLAGYTTFGSIPNYPHVAGSWVVDGFNASSCGSCYDLSYTRSDGTVVTLPFTVVNSAAGGFTSSAQGIEDLTGININDFVGNSIIYVTAVTSSDCGL